MRARPRTHARFQHKYLIGLHFTAPEGKKVYLKYASQQTVCLVGVGFIFIDGGDLPNARCGKQAVTVEPAQTRTGCAVACVVGRRPVTMQAQVPRPCSHIRLRFFSLGYDIV